MKIVIAPDSFKENLSAPDVAKCLEAGFREIFPVAQYVSLPVADGGEGTVEAMVAATGGTVFRAQVTGPLGEPVDGFFGLSGDSCTAFIEMSAASGLALVKPELRNPMLTTSRGTGELIQAALDRGVQNMIIGIGGSATNDAGAGMLQALGVRLLKEDGSEIEAGGQGLAAIRKIDAGNIDYRLVSCNIQVACDVDNPLVGPRGASAVFGPQKGATPDMVTTLDASLKRFGKLLEQHANSRIVDFPGAGAAGGMGAALLGIVKAQLRPGVEIVIEALHLQEAIAGSDLVITGEGRLDIQTAGGKAPAGVARVAAAYGVPVIAIGGSLDAGLQAGSVPGFEAMFPSVPRPCSLKEAFSEAERNLQLMARNVAAALRIGIAIGKSGG